MIARFLELWFGVSTVLFAVATMSILAMLLAIMLR